MGLAQGDHSLLHQGLQLSGRRIGRHRQGTELVHSRLHEHAPEAVMANWRARDSNGQLPSDVSFVGTPLTGSRHQIRRF